MSRLAQLGLGLFGLALAVPVSAQSVPAGMDAPGYAETAPGMEAPQARAASRHDHKGLFGWRHCAECQRARAKARDGVDVPPPPSSMPTGMVMQGKAVHGHNHAQGHVHNPMPASHLQGETCTACEQAAAGGGTIISETVVMSNDPNSPGYASVGGPSAPGYASVGGPSPVGGAAPSPIGVARAHTGPGAPAGAMAGRSSFGTQDSSVMPTSAAIPPAPTPMGAQGPARPRVLSHLFGISDIARDRRERRGKKAEKEREDHASIAYDQGSQPVTELPASMVYGKGDH